MKILIVDDDEIVVEAISQMIKRSLPDMYDISFAFHAVSGLALVEKDCPDILLTDIRMPGMNGLEFIKEISNRGFKPKILILSAYREFEYAQQALLLGALEYILKPVSEQKLVDALNRAMEILKGEREEDKKADKDAAGAAPTCDSSRSETNSVISKAIEYCSNNIFKEITLETVANHVNMNKSYFSYLFKKVTEHNFWEYLTGLKMEKAKELLDTGNVKIYAIAEMLGYKNASHFGRVFKEYAGVTPAEYKSGGR